MTGGQILLAPEFTLPGVDGRQHSLADHADAQVLVLVHTCNHCPYAQAWEKRINTVANDYFARGVRVIAINSNDDRTHPEDSFAEMVKRAESHGLSFDYLRDADQQVARSLGAERTPEVFVFDAARRLVYHGAVDDNRDETAVGNNYLRDALDAILTGQAPAVTDTEAVGCTVKWR